MIWAHSLTLVSSLSQRAWDTARCPKGTPIAAWVSDPYATIIPVTSCQIWKRCLALAGLLAYEKMTAESAVLDHGTIG